MHLIQLMRQWKKIVTPRTNSLDVEKKQDIIDS
jgi:hypothetical protein